MKGKLVRSLSQFRGALKGVAGFPLTKDERTFLDFLVKKPTVTKKKPLLFGTTDNKILMVGCGHTSLFSAPSPVAGDRVFCLSCQDYRTVWGRFNNRGGLET